MPAVSSCRSPNSLTCSPHARVTKLLLLSHPCFGFATEPLVLERQGVVQRHIFEGAPARFETADMPHHDHLIDLDTGKVLEFQSEKIERLQAEIAAELGYDLVRHRLELYCRKREGASQR
jgi:hypothetical protein